MRVRRLGLGDLSSLFPEGIDVFICSASFEERCKSIPMKIGAARVRRALVAENENHKSLHSGNGDFLLGLFGRKSRPVMLDTTNPLKTADELSAALRSCIKLKPKRVVIDITTFTHESFLILFHLAEGIFSHCDVAYLYSGAEEYSVGDKDEDKWLSKGIGEIRSVLGYSGRFLPSRKFHLIVLVGFEHERVNELIRRYEPSFISLGYGGSTEPGAEKHHPPNRHGFDRVKAVYGNAEDFVFYCYDPMKTKRIVQGQAKKVPDTNVVVAALNTKISTMGAALAALEDDSIQLCYAQALLYNYSGYSVPSEKVYLLE